MAEETSTPDTSENEAAAAADVKPPAKTAAKAAPKRATKPKPRIEKFSAVRPDGKIVVVERNVDTGEQTVKVEGA